MQGRNGCREVIETIAWGLATYAVNEHAAGAIAALTQHPPGTIVYNFEQLRDVTAELIQPEISLPSKRIDNWTDRISVRLSETAADTLAFDRRLP